MRAEMTFLGEHSFESCVLGCILLVNLSSHLPHIIQYDFLESLIYMAGSLRWDLVCKIVTKKVSDANDLPSSFHIVHAFASNSPYA